MSFRNDVEKHLGKECVTELLNYVRGGKMSGNQLKDFVLHLGMPEDPKDPNTLYGNHRRRMSCERDRGQDTEVHEVLSDWYKTKLLEMTKEAGIKALEGALSHPDVDCKPLALKLSTINSKVVLLSTCYSLIFCSGANHRERAMSSFIFS